LYDNIGHHIPVVYKKFDNEFRYKNKDTRVIHAVIQNLEIVDEQVLTWEQIIDFKKDHEMQKKYKRLIHWLDSDMIGRDVKYIEDEIAIRLDDYTRALKKHGIMTVTGAISSAMNYKSLLASLIAILGGNFVGKNIEGLLAAGTILIANLCVKVVEGRIGLEETRYGKNSEISYIYEVSKKTK
jgi:hypothetical protein